MDGGSLAADALGAAFGLLALGGPIAAITLGIMVRRDPTVDQASRNMAMAGLVMGCISLGLYVVMLIFVLIAIAICAAACSDYRPCATAAVQAPCVAATLKSNKWTVRSMASARDRFAHHPDLLAFRHDVFHLRGWRLCAGCFTLFPIFLVGLAWLAFHPLPWPMALAAGLPLALAQGVSAAGWTRWRWLKVTVKASCGAGLALVVHGLAVAPGPEWLRSTALVSVAGLAFLSTKPRSRRIERALRASSLRVA
jgi:hypothetical protein